LADALCAGRDDSKFVNAALSPGRRSLAVFGLVGHVDREVISDIGSIRSLIAQARRLPRSGRKALAGSVRVGWRSHGAVPSTRAKIHGMGRSSSKTRPSAPSTPQKSRLVAQTGGAAAVAALLGLVGFVAAAVVESFLNPHLDPATHEISEYAKTPTGWVMTVGFTFWALSMMLLAWAVVTARVRRAAVLVLAFLLLAAAAGVIVLSALDTQTSAGRLPVGVRLTTSGRLHDVGSGLTSIALWLAAICAALDNGLPGCLRRVSVAAATLAVVSDAGLLLIESSVGGVRQRLLIAIACVWLGTLGWMLARRLRS
jgi:Protein of unknown function (DUF998)